MPGYLKARKIDPDLIAVSIFDDGLKYVRIDWKNYLTYSHKVVKIVLFKKDNLFLFVGYSTDDKTIMYNNNFSEIILNQAINQIIDSKKESTTINETRTVQTCTILDEILDQINKFGILSLSNEQKKELLKLSKK